MAGGGVQIGSDRASEFVGHKQKSLFENKTPKQNVRTARTASIDNENDYIPNTENKNSNNRMTQIPLTMDVSIYILISLGFKQGRCLLVEVKRRLNKPISNDSTLVEGPVLKMISVDFPPLNFCYGDLGFWGFGEIGRAHV